MTNMTVKYKDSLTGVWVLLTDGDEKEEKMKYSLENSRFEAGTRKLSIAELIKEEACEPKLSWLRSLFSGVSVYATLDVERVVWFIRNDDAFDTVSDLAWLIKHHFIRRVREEEDVLKPGDMFRYKTETYIITAFPTNFVTRNRRLGFTHLVTGKCVGLSGEHEKQVPIAALKAFFADCNDFRIIRKKGKNIPVWMEGPPQSLRNMIQTDFSSRIEKD